MRGIIADQANFKGQASIVVTLPKQDRGNISFDIRCNVHSVKTSSLFFEDEVERYGIKYQEHQPQWFTMNYCEKERKLHFKNKEYQFYRICRENPLIDTKWRRWDESITN